MAAMISICLQMRMLKKARTHIVQHQLGVATGKPKVDLYWMKPQKTLPKTGYKQFLWWNTELIQQAGSVYPRYNPMITIQTGILELEKPHKSTWKLNLILLLDLLCVITVVLRLANPKEVSTESQLHLKLSAKGLCHKWSKLRLLFTNTTSMVLSRMLTWKSNSSQKARCSLPILGADLHLEISRKSKIEIQISILPNQSIGKVISQVKVKIHLPINQVVSLSSNL